MKAAVMALTIVSSSLASFLGIALFRKASVHRNWFDVPNERSLHVRPIPRGAGVVLVVIALMAHCLLSVTDSNGFSLAYFVGASLVAGISWADDLYSLSEVWRLLVHFIASAVFVILTGSFSSVGLPGGAAISLGSLGPIITVIWIVGIINIYNFMDGIDGIAGGQAIVTSAAWAVLAAMIGSSFLLTMYCLAILGTSIGFLVHNWSPARVFMGDVGSAFLGYTFAVIPILVQKSSTVSLPCLPVAALFFLWPFIFDSTLTLARRLLQRRQIWKAHREHLYQSLILADYSHRFVAIMYVVFAGASVADFLFPLAFVKNAAALSVALLLLTTIVFALMIYFLIGNMRKRAVTEIQNAKL